MSMDYFAELPPELIALLPPHLPPRSLSAVVLTCRRMHAILQPELDALITPGFRRHLLLKAATGDAQMVAKLLSSPHSVDLDEGYGGDRTPLHVAADAGNREIVALLLAARADVTARWRKGGMQALHLAVCNVDLEMMKLLLDHGAPVDQPFGEARDSDVTALDHSCAIGHMEMVQLLLDRGANIEHQGSLGTALGFAVTSRKPGAVKLLLDKGANAAAHWMARPQHPGDLLYVAMRIRNPPQRPSETRAKWKGQPLGEPRKQLMALLLAYGASKDTTLETIRARLAPLATEAKYTEDEYMATISGMLTEAEDAIPEVLAMYK